MFLEINTNKEFDNFLSAFACCENPGLVEFLYDCGSSNIVKNSEDLKSLRFKTTEFKKNTSTPLRDQFSKVVGVSCNEKVLTKYEKEEFELNLTEQMKYETIHYFKWLKENQDDVSLVSSIFTVDLECYLNTLNFDSNKYTVKKSDLKILKAAHNHFFYLKHKGLLESDENVHTSNDPVLNELHLCHAEENMIKLPKNVILKHYSKLKTMLLNAGGVYKNNAFDFGEQCALTIKARLLEGEMLNDKKKYQQFFTPKELAVIAFQMLGLKHGETWAEPSAGSLNLACLAEEVSPNNGTLVEIDPKLCKKIRNSGFSVIEGDYLNTKIDQVDKIIANPPFSNPIDTDLKHVRKMYKDLKSGGTLVSFMSTRILKPSNAAHHEFIEFLKQHEYELKKIPHGMFISSGTNIESLIVKIKKPSLDA